MDKPSQFRKIMEGISALFLCLLIFVVRATISVWNQAGVANRICCIVATLACVLGVAMNRKASNVALPPGPVQHKGVRLR